MNSTERKAFWDALCSIRDDSPEHIQTILATIKIPKCLCRYRSVSESSLLQLQENKLYFSSAYYYDDPFDTFIHVDLVRIKKYYEYLSALDESGLVGFLKPFEIAIGIRAEQFVENLKHDTFELSTFTEDIKQVREIIQKILFSICFCEDALNETLWLKYANNYRGFALVYNVKDENTFLCGKEEECKKCKSMLKRPYIYPVYYAEEPYDASQYALACMLQGKQVPTQVLGVFRNASMWEAERISLIKKKCHEYDKEWRMIRPAMMPERTCIKMKPQKIILGLRMPAY